jgi:hypothetical protein
MVKHFLPIKPTLNLAKLLSEIAQLGIIWCYAMELSLYQIVRFAAPNIMVGNTILLNMLLWWCGIAMEELFKEAQSKGLYTNLLISGRRSTALVSDERIKGFIDR